ncbi:shikimate dehydrogenase [Deinococcus cellulosilyticus]|uniref:Shikimate dehydrogenase (NADP(+)) n=1 Tax=Deinococcus cellulosilyticus (strain DSM 18568 / NBRC 106333 / KACC 11606 / 5516J-15) TaxID=1223518 RepID=A0A511N4X5_DEIC1|nr:shikimate dehydrogenase [Deinococcus cellulosilyticus]GEM47895.1 shikimate dehydrogenase (NADP(+)) [Deinococcus cellulosilyticus NBRC 106333 = KACC 11606]
MKRAFLFAHPAAHSLSPRMHNAAFQWIGMDGVYQAVDIEPSCLGKALLRLKEPEVIGANLSLPHKEAVIPFLDEIEPVAKRIGAVNTLMRRDGKLMGTNTDADGFYQSLLEGGYQPQGVALILGAGGAARAAVHALSQAGLTIWIQNRTPSRAEHLLESMQVEGRVFATQEEIPFKEVGLLVNSSSAGLSNPQESPLTVPFPELQAGATVYDMVYKPLYTRLLLEAQEHGYNTVTGIGMLVHQARLAFERWTGQAVPASVMFDAVKDTLQ